MHLECSTDTVHFALIMQRYVQVAVILLVDTAMSRESAGAMQDGGKPTVINVFLQAHAVSGISFMLRSCIADSLRVPL